MRTLEEHELSLPAVVRAHWYFWDMGAKAMISSWRGNLLAADVDALVNTVNTVGIMGIMGKGIALQFKRAYPEMFTAYERACRSGDVTIGRMHVWETGSLQGPRFIVNFPTKRHWKSNSRLADIEAGLDDLVRVIRQRGIRSIAIPPLGCGHGGLPWRDVEPRILAALGPLDTDVDIRIYPQPGPQRPGSWSAAPRTLDSPMLARPCCP